MKDHECEPPKADWPGEEWTCAACGQQWWADEVGYDFDTDTAHLVWRRHEATE